MKIYDLIVIGSGPAGVSAAKVVSSKGMSVLIIERGKDMSRRRDLTSGWFGHGLYAMNRLELEDPILKNKRAIREAFKVVQQVSSEIPQIIKPNNKPQYCRLSDSIGKELAEYYYNSVSRNADIVFNTEVDSVVKDGSLFIIKTPRKEYRASRCLVATGKNSLEWIKQLCAVFNITPAKNGIRVGIRVEVPTFRINEMLQDVGDIRIDCDDNISTEDARLNSFVGEWEDSNILSAFGHGMPNKKSERTNFMVGTEPQNEKETEGALREVKIANVLQNDKIRPERIKDYVEGKSVLEHLETFNKLKQSFRYLETFFPAITTYAIMYAPEVRLRGILPVDTQMRTIIEGLYGAGECTARVSSLIGAMASGIVAARNILKE
jgi:uncharacterized FAD-dependent dehydrogenase